MLIYLFLPFFMEVEGIHGLLVYFIFVICHYYFSSHIALIRISQAPIEEMKIRAVAVFTTRDIFPMTFSPICNIPGFRICGLFWD